MTDGASERAARRSAAQAQETLHVELRRERARRAELEREVAATRGSTSFRFGQALALALRGIGRRERGRLVLAAAGRLLGGQRHAAPDAGPPRTNVVAFVAWGLDAEALERAVARVDRLHRVLGDFEPLFLLDALDAEPVRRRGHPFEYVVGLEEWRHHRPAHEWGRYVTERVGAMAAAYEPRLVVVLEAADGPGALEQGVLDALIVPSLARTEDNRFGAARREDPAALAAEMLMAASEGARGRPRS